MAEQRRSVLVAWTLFFAPMVIGCQGMAVDGADDSNTAAVSAPSSIFPASSSPATLSSDDTGAVELGVKFRSDVAGSVTGIRFYKGSGNSGTHVGNLWSRTGTKLASATFTSETASGWQQVTFASPVAISANTTYVASYFAPVGHYSYTAPYFTSAADNPPLHALADGVDGPDGVFAYGSSSSFPNQTWNTANYWVDVLFVSSAAPSNSSIWPATATPANASADDVGSVELGVKFRSDVAGSITAIRFYKGSGNSGTHIGNLWSRTGTRLASATFTSETASGWQQVNFANPVAISANTTYVASYFAPAGHYAYNVSFFSKGVDTPPLHALADGVDGADGVFAYGSSSAFPSQTYSSSNYWVDVVFSSSSPSPGAPTVSITSPSSGAKFTAGSNVTIQATAAAASGRSVSKVVFSRSGTVLCTVTASPFNCAWNNVALGSYSLTATATDSAGVSTTSSAVSVTVQAAQSSGPALYVSPSGSDSNDGSAAHPFATIQHAANSATAGMTIHVASGSYQPVTTSANGTASARIRYISDVQWGAKVVGASGAEAAWMQDGSYVDLMGFDISGGARIGIENNGSFVRTIGNYVHNIAGSCSSDGGAGIDNSNYSASNDDIIGNIVGNIGPSPGTCNTVQGIYLSNAGGITANNIVYGVSAWGIQMWHAATNATIVNNTVFNCYGGIVVGAGDSPGGVTSDNTLVANNIVYKNTGYGIYEFGATGVHNRYLNNLVNGNPTQISLQNGLTASGTVNADPLFVTYQANGSGNYRLQSSSPAINAGTSTSAPALDFDGGARPMGGAWDIGAYELGATAAAWPWY